MRQNSPSSKPSSSDRSTGWDLKSVGNFVLKIFFLGFNFYPLGFTIHKHNHWIWIILFITHTKYAVVLIVRGPTWKIKVEVLLRTMPWSKLFCVLILEICHDRTSWNPSLETPFVPTAKRRRKASPGPVIVIKDEPEEEDEVHFVREPTGGFLF